MPKVISLSVQVTRAGRMGWRGSALASPVDQGLAALSSPAR